MCWLDTEPNRRPDSPALAAIFRVTPCSLAASSLLAAMMAPSFFGSLFFQTIKAGQIRLVRHNGEPFRDEVVASVAVFHFNDFMFGAYLFNMFEQNNIH